MDDPEQPNVDDLILKVESDEEQTTFVLTIFTSTGRKIDPSEVILEIECYLHEVTQAQIARSSSGSLLH